MLTAADLNTLNRDLDDTNCRTLYRNTRTGALIVPTDLGYDSDDVWAVRDEPGDWHLASEVELVAA